MHDDEAQIKNVSEKKRNFQSNINLFLKKRLVNAAERRHQKKMQRQDKFLECFNEYIQILHNKKEGNSE